MELKPKSERPALQVVLDDLRRELSPIAGISTFMSPVQNLRLGGRSSRSQYQYVLQAVDKDSLFAWSEKVAAAMDDDPHFADVSSDLEDSAQQVSLIVDRDKANALGISTNQLRSTLYSGFGTRQVSTIYETGDNYSVVLELDPAIAWSPDLLDTVYVRSASGTLVPIGAFAEVRRSVGELSINQLGQLPAVTISFNLPPGVSLGQAVARAEALRTQLGLPETITSTFSGTAQEFQDALDNMGLLILAAVLTIYIVLGILYESFVHPFTILTGLPSAAIGAFIALDLASLDLSVVAVIGILMLIGIVKKNAIMMIDVALDVAARGHGAAGCDLSRLHPALPPDHDDDLCRAHGRAADRPRRRRQRGAAPAARHRGGRRPGRFAGADPVHHARALSLHGAAVAGAARIAQDRSRSPDGLSRLAEAPMVAA